MDRPIMQVLLFISFVNLWRTSPSGPKYTWLDSTPLYSCSSICPISWRLSCSVLDYVLFIILL